MTPDLHLKFSPARDPQAECHRQSRELTAPSHDLSAAAFCEQGWGHRDPQCARAHPFLIMLVPAAVDATRFTLLDSRGPSPIPRSRCIQPRPICCGVLRAMTGAPPPQCARAHLFLMLMPGLRAALLYCFDAAGLRREEHSKGAGAAEAKSTSTRGPKRGRCGGVDSNTGKPYSNASRHISSMADFSGWFVHCASSESDSASQGSRNATAFVRARQHREARQSFPTWGRALHAISPARSYFHHVPRRLRPTTHGQAQSPPRQQTDHKLAHPQCFGRSRTALAQERGTPPPRRIAQCARISLWLGHSPAGANTPARGPGF